MMSLSGEDKATTKHDIEISDGVAEPENNASDAYVCYFPSIFCKPVLETINLKSPGSVSDSLSSLFI